MRPPLAVVVASGMLAAGLAAATFAEYAGDRGPDAAPSPSFVPGTAVAEDALVARGRRLFQSKGCVGCHTGPAGVGSMQIGPSLVALRDVAGTRKPGMSAEAYVRESIRSPQAFVAPGYGCSNCLGMPDLGLSDAEIDGVTAFLLRGN